MHLLVGIDTEGDNQWDAAARANQRFENIYALPRLHALFARHGVRPTYVITHPVATDPRSAEVLRGLKAGGDCEIGAHHHAWETPPCTVEDIKRHSYASNLPLRQFEDQLASLTDAIEGAVGARPVSYRSGRFGFSAAHVPALERLGYKIESSVAPLFYEAHKNGPDFVEAPLRPYFLSYDSATRPGTSGVLEVPVSAALNRAMPKRLQYLYARAPRNYMTKRVLRKLGVARMRWLRPSYSSLEDMIGLARDLAEVREPVLNLLFHSSEAIVGGSPYNKTEAELTAFCDRLERFFEFAIGSLGASPVTFTEFANSYTAPTPDPRSPIPDPRPPTSDLRMRIVHITPHLPPDQAANALLPFQLGEWATARGDSVHFVAYPPASGSSEPRPNVIWIPRTRRTLWQNAFRLGSIAGAWRIRREAEAIIKAADLVHVHSNGLLPEIGSRIAHRLGKPVVLTLYGTEIWHYRPKTFRPDLFTGAYKSANAVTFYSRRLLERAQELGLDRPRCHVIYPPVAAAFQHHDRTASDAVRRSLGLTAANLLVNVKRLHPLAGQRYLIEALPDVIREHPDTHLVICGTGALLPELQAVARSAAVERHVTFAGLVDNALVARYCAAADLFVLPSLLEALPTVAVEALACGTPVVSSDNPGGVELQGVFGDDVAVVPKEQPAALATAIRAALREKRRTRAATQAIVEERFRADAVARQFFAIYTGVVRP